MDKSWQYLDWGTIDNTVCFILSQLSRCDDAFIPPFKVVSSFLYHLHLSGFVLPHEFGKYNFSRLNSVYFTHELTFWEYLMKFLFLPENKDPRCN